MRAQTLIAYTKLGMQICNDYYVVSFPIVGGGFEGNSHISLSNYVNATTYTALVHSLFHGTGAFEGQTLNVGVDRGPAANMVWEGYLLKR
ncbi:MAG TPA: hypothetical protein VK209_01690 [Candidatus Sulfotelmatobacter sp.]|nr:hypothetical protein [Candidatus Sulfotelmatobacter sp.]